MRLVEAREKTIVLQGKMIDLWNCLDLEVLVEGPAGTAKTRTILEVLDYTARKYKTARILIVRKSRVDMTHSVMTTFDRDVKLPDVHFHTPSQSYRYPNGSIIAVGGLDRASKILSSEWDLIYVNESTELSLSDWETLLPRLRSSVVPYAQIIGDANPDIETHFLNKRADTELMTRIVTTHKDNPRYYDEETGSYTEEGERYIEGVLAKLTGVRRLRFYKGIWASREGLVYSEFLRSRNVIESGADLPTFVRRYRAIDFGFTNPFVCQWWGEDYDGRLYLYREIYFSGKTVNKHADEIKRLESGVELSEWEELSTEQKNVIWKTATTIVDPEDPEEYLRKEVISYTVADHDAEDRATLHEHGIFTVAAKKAIVPGIEAVIGRLVEAGDGRPRIYVCEDARTTIDADLEGKYLPTSTLEEFSSYSWPDKKENLNQKEVPIDAYNHGMDALRYLVVQVDGYARVSSPPKQPVQASKWNADKRRTLDLERAPGSNPPRQRVTGSKWRKF